MKSISVETIVFSLGFAVTPCKLCGFFHKPPFLVGDTLVCIELELELVCELVSVTMSLFPLTGRVTHSPQSWLKKKITTSIPN